MSVIERGGRVVGWTCITAAILLGVWLGRSEWPVVGGWLARWWPLALVVALLAVGIGVLELRRRNAVDGSVSAEMVPRPLSTRTIVVCGVFVAVVGTVAVVVLLRVYGHGEASDQLDAIRTAGTIVVGTGGAAALLLVARRQRATELTLDHQREVARSADADATERRITDLYTKAVEQLGSEKAPVRLGGLYALERLAQDNPRQRQTIVNVLCAYLRMPYTLPGDPPDDDADDKLITAHHERVQEREVRLAAQYILAHHLRPEGDPDGPLNDEDSLDDEPLNIFWANIDLILTGATLIDLNLSHCTIRTAGFEEASFTGDAYFYNTTFTRHAWFIRATFTGDAHFEDANFIREARFDDATFTGGASFGRTTFNFADFREAIFTGDAHFNGAAFDAALFDGAALPSTRYTDVNTPSPWSDFRGASFEWHVPAEVAQFVSPPTVDAADDATVW